MVGGEIRPCKNWWMNEWPCWWTYFLSSATALVGFVKMLSFTCMSLFCIIKHETFHPVQDAGTTVCSRTHSCFIDVVLIANSHPPQATKTLPVSPDKLTTAEPPINRSWEQHTPYINIMNLIEARGHALITWCACDLSWVQREYRAFFLILVCSFDKMDH